MPQSECDNLRHPGAGSEVQSSEQRRAPRSSLVLRSAKIVCQTGEYASIIRDVSTDGVGIKFFHAIPPEPRVLLALANGDTYPIERVWSGKRQAGYRFAKSIDLNEFLHEPSPFESRPIRLRIDAAAEIEAGTEAFDAALLDLSCGGASVETTSRFPVGTRLRLTCEGLAARSGVIMWREKTQFGLRFDRALAVEDLAQIALTLQPIGSPDDFMAPVAENCSANAA